MKQPDSTSKKTARTKLLLRAANNARNAMQNGGIDITKMTRDERRAVLFGKPEQLDAVRSQGD